MRLISLLNHYQHFPGFVYERARHCAPSQTIEISVRPRRGSRPVCSGCHKPAAAYDHLSLRRFEFVPLWGCMVVLLYCMRRVDCRACGVRVEAVPWGIGKHQLTKAYMLFLAHWARKLSWQETAVSFRTTWDKVCQSVEYVVQWGIEHRQLGSIAARVLDGPCGQETVAVSGRFAANEMQAVTAAAIAGYGIAQLPYQVAEASVRSGRLRRVLGDYTTPVGGLYAVYPSSQHVSPLVKEFIELAAERLAATGTGEDDKA